MSARVDPTENLTRIQLTNNDIPCFWCGVCCTIYQVYLEMDEATGIAARLGLSWNDFLKEYTDPRWQSQHSVLLRQTLHGCLFLDQPVGSVFGLCRIHAFKPKCCREWQAKIWKKECRQGLSKFWGLCVDEDDCITGQPEEIAVFQNLLPIFIEQGD